MQALLGTKSERATVSDRSELMETQSQKQRMGADRRM